MEITTLAAWGEFLGGIAVVVTLIYLAGQLRQTTKALRITAYQGYNIGAFSWADTMMQYNPEWSAIMQVGDLSELTNEQRNLLARLTWKAFVLTESNYLHHRAGSMDDDVFEAHMVGGLAFISGVPIVRQAWEEFTATGTGGIVPDFAEYFDKRLKALDEAGGPTYSRLEHPS